MGDTLLRAIDQTGDLNGQRLYRLKQLYPVPAFVKNANASDIYGDEPADSRLCADPVAGRFPCHTAAATYVSTMFYLDKQANINEKRGEAIEARLQKFAEMHGRKPVIHSHLLYRNSRRGDIPPDSIGLALLPEGGLAAVLTDEKGARQKVDPLEIGTAYTHPALGYRFNVAELYPRAKREEHFTNQNNDVRREAIHMTASDGRSMESAWILLGGSVRLAIGADPANDPVTVEYRPAVRQLPFSVRLIDFRRIDHPGISMAAGFEADVELIDPARGLTMKKKISMNNPLKHRGYSFFQSSYIQGAVETTVLSVRNDPGVPLVYGGFLIIVAGVATMFILRPYRKPVEA